MKKNLRKLMVVAVAAVSTLTVNAQQTATFENLILAPNSFWNGSTSPKGTTFESGDAIFHNYYDGYWNEGWVYSNKNDSTTPGVSNMYSARAGSGYNSSNYALGQQGSVIRLKPNAIGGKVNSVYVTNGTYAALSMKTGDSFAKKFGDSTRLHPGVNPGSYPDWFKLTIKGYSNGMLKNDSVDFYLADYRFADNSKDYIVKTWQRVELTPLGNVDSVLFTLTSTDTGKWGINTPLFFCIDNFTTESMITRIATTSIPVVKMYPNPTTDQLTIDLTALEQAGIHMVDIVDVTGRKMETLLVDSPLIHLSVSAYQSGVYFISVKNDDSVINTTFIKN